MAQRVLRTTPARLALYLIWITGCRVGDLIGWTPEDLDEQGQAWVRFRQRKNGNEGAFPITHVEYERLLATADRVSRHGSRPLALVGGAVALVGVGSLIGAAQTKSTY